MSKQEYNAEHSDGPYKMTMNLNVLKHLGLNLYSNVPAVLSEAVANAWDADATKVHVNIEQDRITIVDDGNGMDQEDINNKYLQVGYQKRLDGFNVTPIFKRPVMGRKGIGKLSLFSISKNIEIHTMKDSQKRGFIIDTELLEQKIKNNDSEYYPVVVNEQDIAEEIKGTTIILTNLKKRTTNTAAYLRKRLARRFSVIGSKNNFEIFIDGKPLRIEDRDYFHKLEYIWCYPDENEDEINFFEYCKDGKLKKSFQRSSIIEGTEYKVKGWIGTVENSGDLKDDSENINKIVIMVRGKLAQEDILEDFSEGGLYSKYIIGEIHADFLDSDEEEDIATSSRQKIIEDDPRYEKLQEFIRKELKNIQRAWTDLRNSEGEVQALKIPAIQNWFSELGKDHKTKAKSLFGKINQLTLDENAKKDLFKHSVLAFESFKYKENLDALDKITPENIEIFSQVFSDFDDIEATLYHQIIVERLKVIDLLKQKVDDNSLEKVLQEHLYNHLWLLDPSWDRATEIPAMEQRMTTAFTNIDEGLGLTEEEKNARFDIKYKKSSGKHVIIELKRAHITIDTYKLSSQVDKYKTTLKKILESQNSDHEPIEIICIVGRPLKQWGTPEGKSTSLAVLKANNARIVLYDQLVADAQIMYQAFLEKNKEAGRISRLIDEIDQDSSFGKLEIIK